MAELEIEGQTEISFDNTLDITANGNSIAVDVEDSTDLNITINKKEFNIVGDELYIPKYYDDAPEWMQELIEFTVNFGLDTKIDDVNELSKSLEELIEALDVAKNTYEQSIISSDDIDQRILTAITTLNSSLREADATILSVAQTAVTPDEARAITEEVLQASIDDPDTPGSLGAIIGDIRQVIATGDSANATSVQTLTATIEGIDDVVEANASVMQTLQAYVGVDDAGASTGTGLSAYLESTDGSIGGADSKVANSVYVDDQGNVKSKWEYGSTLNIDGVTYNSGFGINATGTGAVDDPFDSEFWINCEKFKFTNNNNTGQAAPFSIDASGATPKVTFDGLVDFTSTNVGSGFPGTTTINGGLVETGTLSADRLTSTTGDTTVWDGGGLVSANFDGNSYGEIGSPTSGFRVSSNAAGTQTDPNMYGAYIVGGDINGVRITGSEFVAVSLDVGNIKVKSASDTTKTGNITQTVSSGSIVGSDYGTGFLPNRVCSDTAAINIQSYMDISIVDDGNFSNDGMSGTAQLQYQVDSGSWIALDTNSYSGIFSGNIGNNPGIRQTMVFGSILSGSAVPSTSTIQFRSVVVDSSNSVVTSHSTSFIATIYNQ